jgi:hypothetical protein
VGKAIAFVLFLPVAVLVAGLFGALHDQISYTVSPEYFTKFKFIQFGLLDPASPERLRAAEVGFLASWWTGLPLGFLCGGAGFVQRSPALMRRALLWSLPLIVGVTLAAALAGLAYGWHRTQSFAPGSDFGWYVPPDVTDHRGFVCVAYMHSAAYLGGALSVPVAWIFHLVFRACRTPTIS